MCGTRNTVHEAVWIDLQSPATQRSALAWGDMVGADLRVLIEPPSASDSCHYETSFAPFVIAGLLEAIEWVFRDEATVIELDRSDLHLEPRPELDAVEVRFDLHDVPDDVRDYEPDLIDRESFVEEAYRAGRRWRDEAYEINPDLDDIDWFQDVQRALADAEAALDREGIDVDELSNSDDI